jgi:hypothetical protein
MQSDGNKLNTIVTRLTISGLRKNYHLLTSEITNIFSELQRAM